MVSVLRCFLEKRERAKPENKYVEDLLADSDNAKDALTVLTNELVKEKAKSQKLDEKYRTLYRMVMAVIDAMPGIIWGTDLDGKFILTNKNLRDTLLGGVSINDARKGSARSFGEARGDTLHLDCERTSEIVLAKEDSCCFVEKGKVNNKDVTYKTSKAPLKDKHGDIVGVVGFGRDVTATCYDLNISIDKIKASVKACPNDCLYFKEVRLFLDDAIGILESFDKQCCERDHE